MGPIRGARGQSLVELTVMLPFLLALVLGGLDLGRVFYTTAALRGAAREGVRVAADHRATSAMITGAVVGAVATGQGVTGHIDFSWIDICTSASPCPSAATFPVAVLAGSPSPLMVTVTVAAPFRPVTPFVQQFFPGGVATLVASASGPVL